MTKSKPRPAASRPAAKAARPRARAQPAGRAHRLVREIRVLVRRLDAI